MGQNGKAEKERIGITTGDPNGIGLEVIIKTFQDNRMLESMTPILYGSSNVLSYHLKSLNIQKFDHHVIDSPEEAKEGRLNLVECWKDEIKLKLGQGSEEGGKFAFASLERATKDIASNSIDAMVTAPINKHFIRSDKFDFPGHTEYLTKYANMEDSLMMMVSEGFRVGIVSGHVPLEKVPEDINEERILTKLEIMEQSLIKDFLIEKPRIAVLALNPHAGDAGMMGTQENDIISPAIQKAKDEKGKLVFGPYPADGFFGSEEPRKFHGILAMYHDQGLTPFKALSFDRGVNFTAGLPIVRTSPDHGTAYEIAGEGKASPISFRNAVFLAKDIFRNRKTYKEMTADPLQPQPKSPFMKKDRSK